MYCLNITSNLMSSLQMKTLGFVVITMQLEWTFFLNPGLSSCTTCSKCCPCDPHPDPGCLGMSWCLWHIIFPNEKSRDLGRRAVQRDCTERVHTGTGLHLQEHDLKVIEKEVFTTPANVQSTAHCSEFTSLPFLLKGTEGYRDSRAWIFTGRNRDC